jgi:hypothetical protein
MDTKIIFLLMYSSLTKIIVYCYNSRKQDIYITQGTKRLALIDKIIVLEQFALHEGGSILVRLASQLDIPDP